MSGMTIHERISAALITPPKRFQVRGVRFLIRKRGRAVLGDDMGLGKTYQFIAYAALHPDLRPVVVVCPASLKYNWQDEFWKHAKLESDVLDGTTPYVPDGDIWIINYDILFAWSHYLRGKVRLLGIDECQKIKTRNTRRTKACRSIVTRGCHVIPMSATPIMNRPIEFYPALHIVAPKLFPSFMQYAMSYCNPKRGWKGRGWNFNGASNLGELHKKISTIMIRRTKTEVMSELPVKQRTVIPMDIDNRAEYRRAQREFIEWYVARHGANAAKRAKRAIAIVRFNALKRLVASGKSAMVAQWIADWREETNEKLVMFTVHHSSAQLLAEQFPKALVMDGSVPTHHRQKLVNEFQQNPERWLIIGTIKTLGVGHTLTAASTVGFMELEWTPGDHDQAEDRVLRIGQLAKKMTAFYFIGKNTVEEKVVKLLDKKRNIVSQIVDGREDVDVFASAIDELINETGD